MSERIGYVLKVYPRFSETFVVTEVLAREDCGDDLAIYALRPTTDARFHPEIARVKAPVTWVPRARKASDLWGDIGSVIDRHPDMAERLGRIMPLLTDLPGDEVGQGVWLAAAAREDGITHLHAHFASLAGRMAWIAGTLADIPYTVTTHAKDIFHEDVDPTWLRRICADADRVIAISRFNEDHLQAVLEGTGARICQQYNALELARFPFAPPAPVGDGLEVVAVGRLVEKKGFGLLVEAAARLKDAGTDITVRIAGAGDLEQDLREQVLALGVADRVELLGPRTQNEVLELVAGADVMAAPCIPAEDGNMDGLPTVVLEAMALGTPVIGTDVTGLPEVLLSHPDGTPRTGILLPAGDTDALTRALADFAAERYDAASIALDARALIEERFDSRRQGAQLSAWEHRAPATDRQVA